jgi:DNA-binding transcriptional MocR family regulator
MSAFEAALGDRLELRRTDAGIQLVATFRRPTDDRRFAAAAAEAGVNVSPYSMQFRHGGGTPGLVLGFAAAGAKARRRGLSALAEVAARPET